FGSAGRRALWPRARRGRAAGRRRLIGPAERLDLGPRLRWAAHRLEPALDERAQDVLLRGRRLARGDVRCGDDQLAAAPRPLDRVCQVLRVAAADRGLLLRREPAGLLGRAGGGRRLRGLLAAE